ncbi:MAG: UTP--glucose-1-phosphate uridylyltransferase GalU [Gammaproteobacteria bacterium]|nr:UTP--glucose-1-phosphate uridylyltransferase GalU [Gammaproteobacteria bacterium]
MARVRKAVFPVAGMGTRFLPATKASPKEMLPIIDKPLIQYAAEEAVSAGIDTLIFITGRHKRSIEDHFDKAYELESELEAQQKFDLLELVQNVIPAHVNCIYIRQSEPLGLGHAVLCAEQVVNKEPFAVLLADDLFHYSKSVGLAQMVNIHDEHHCSVVGVQEVKKEEVSRYGVISGATVGKGLWQVNEFVEKPAPENAPSNIVIAGRYILESSIFKRLRKIQAGADGEIQLTDALSAMVRSDKVLAYQIEGKRFDCGSKLGYLQATVEMALEHPLIGNEFREYLARYVALQQKNS